MSSQLTVWEESPQKKFYGSFENGRFKYWILTVKLDLWRIPETIDVLNNVKYIRGQQEFSEEEYLHWQLAVEYFKPAKFHTVKQQFPGAHIEPVYASRHGIMFGKNKQRFLEVSLNWEMILMLSKRCQPEV